MFFLRFHICLYSTAFLCRWDYTAFRDFAKEDFTMHFTSFLENGKLTIALSGEIDHHCAKARSSEPRSRPICPRYVCWTFRM